MMKNIRKLIATKMAKQRSQTGDSRHVMLFRDVIFMPTHVAMSRDYGWRGCSAGGTGSGGEVGWFGTFIVSAKPPCLEYPFCRGRHVSLPHRSPYLLSDQPFSRTQMPNGKSVQLPLFSQDVQQANPDGRTSRH